MHRFCLGLRRTNDHGISAFLLMSRSLAHNNISTAKLLGPLLEIFIHNFIDLIVIAAAIVVIF